MKKIIVLLILFCPAVSLAAYTSTPRHPTTYAINPATGQWTTYANIEARSNTSAPTKYITRQVALSAASAGKLARAAMGGPLGVAVLAATVVHDWEWDDANQVFQSPAVSVDYDNSLPGTSCDALSHCSRGCNASYMCTQSGQIYYGFGPWSTKPPNAHPPNSEWVGTNSCGNICGSEVWGAVIYRSVNVASSYSGENSPNNPTYVPPQAVSDSQLGDAILASPSITNDVLRDSINRNTWGDNWSEMVSALSDVSAAMENYYEGDQTTYDPDIVDRATDTTPEYSSEFSLEFPEFCSWATVVCTFIDWMMGPPEEPAVVELPVVETELQEWDSGLGAGSCPSGYTMSYGGQSHTFEYTDICWGASTIFRPILIVLSLISAAYILIGARQ